MKYIKKFESKKFVNEIERKMYNFSQRLERAINKFFGASKNGHWYRKSIPARLDEDKQPTYTYISYYFSTFAFSLYDKNINKSKFKALVDELNTLKIDYRSYYNSMTYELTFEQAEKLLDSLKNGDVEKRYLEYEIKKYNI